MSDAPSDVSAAAEAPSCAEPKRWKRIVMSALALLVIYGNVAVTFNPAKLGLPQYSGLPRSFALHDAFLITGMFSGYTSFNFDFFLEGRGGDGTYRELALQEYFPLRTALTFTQLFAAHHWDMLGPSGQRAAWAVLAQKIKARHNRLHPDAPIDKLRFGVFTYPQSNQGYRVLSHAAGAWKRLWYAEP